MHRLVLAGAAFCAASLCAACGHHSSEPLKSPSRPLAVTGAYPRYGHAADFSWIAGRLAQRLNGCSYLVYDAAARTRPSRRIALVASPDALAAFPGGDMVVAFGRLTSAPQGECGSPAFAADAIEEH
ncbi:MAG TPA: hypothetical protein VIX35_09755 [Vicinamibacterales bacterium]